MKAQTSRHSPRIGWSSLPTIIELPLKTFRTQKKDFYFIILLNLISRYTFAERWNTKGNFRHKTPPNTHSLRHYCLSELYSPQYFPLKEDKTKRIKRKGEQYCSTGNLSNFLNIHSMGAVFIFLKKETLMFLKTQDNIGIFRWVYIQILVWKFVQLNNMGNGTCYHSQWKYIFISM